MSTMEVFMAGIFVGMLFGLLFNRCAYRNGACDGFVWGRYPKHPGMQKAGKAIRENLSHMHEMPKEDQQ